MIIYALRRPASGRLMGFSASTNEGDFCVGVSYSLEEVIGDEAVWTTTSRAIAERVANTDTEWYNADLDSPGNAWPGELEVVEFHSC